MMNINELEQNVYYDEILNKIDNVYYNFVYCISNITDLDVLYKFYKIKDYKFVKSIVDKYPKLFDSIANDITIVLLSDFVFFRTLIPFYALNSKNAIALFFSIFETYNSFTEDNFKDNSEFYLTQINCFIFDFISFYNYFNYKYSDNLKISPLFKEIIKQDLTNFPYVKELVMQNI